MQANLYIGHGTRSKTGVKEVKAFMERVMKRVDVPIQEISFLELTEPLIEEGFQRCVKRGATEITVIPLFLLAAGHIKQDIPQAVAAFQEKHPHIHIEVKDPFGVQGRILDAIAELAKSSAGNLRRSDRLLIVGRGSSDPGILSDFSRIQEGVERRLGIEHVSVCYLAAAEPCLQEGLTAILEKASGTAIVVPYLLFSGLLSAEVNREVLKWKKQEMKLLVTEPLSRHQVIEDIVAEMAAGNPQATHKLINKHPIVRWISLQLQVVNNPFSPEQAKLLERLLPTLIESQKVWLSGYLAATLQPTFIQGNSEQTTVQQTSQTTNRPAVKEATILYGSQTGNAQELAKKCAKALEAKGLKVTVSSTNDFKPNNLKKIQNLLIVVSTHGEGDPPDNALTFHEFIHSKRAPELPDLKFSVLALGDSSYEFFCQTGKDFDQRLEELGGTRLYPRFDCDVDFDEPAADWLQGVLGSLGETTQNQNPVTTPAASLQTVESVYSRTNPFQAELLENINLNGRGSNKETRHLEISLEGSGLTFEPGDSLGIYPDNDPALVDLLLYELKWNPEESVTVKTGDVRPFTKALLSYYEITVLTKPLLGKISKLSDNKALQELLSPGNEEKVKEYMKGRDLLDVVRDFGSWGESAQEFVSVLRKIPARLYSIASSLTANPEEVHLTIGAVRYEINERQRNGVCSILAAERVQLGDTLQVFVQHNENFKLPQNPDAPIIMVGPGTGVAPFRSFMQEREEIGEEGKSWLFFGDQHFVTDFLYQTEWQSWLKSGVLTKVDVAFSRDQEEKVYVQHRMLEHSKELFEWLEAGAYFYVCGDEKNMAHDVHNTLLGVIEKEGSMTREQAVEYLTNLQQQRRYQRDVY